MLKTPIICTIPLQKDNMKKALKVSFTVFLHNIDKISHQYLLIVLSKLTVLRKGLNGTK